MAAAIRPVRLDYSMTCSLSFGLLFSGLLFSAAAQAQVTLSLGPRVGLNAATTREASTPDGVRLRYYPGGEAGVMGTLACGRWAVQPALLYAQKGYAYRSRIDYRSGNGPFGTADLDGTVRFNYLALPVSLAYRAHDSGQGVQVFAGPYLALLLGGRYAYTIAYPTDPQTYQGPIASGEGAPSSFRYRRYDAGLQAGLGYRHQALLFQVAYSLGLTSTTVDAGGTAGRADAYNRAFQASVGYLFTPRVKAE